MFDLEVFMDLIFSANPTFNRLKNSSIKELCRLLNEPFLSELQLALDSTHIRSPEVSSCIDRIPPHKRYKYRDALWYLMANVPTLPYKPMFLVHPKTDAAIYFKKPLSPTYNPDGRPKILNKPLSQFKGQTVEEFLIQNGKETGILSIHLSSFEPPMNDIFDNRKVVDHMKSVLRIGCSVGSELLCLYMSERPICEELSKEANSFKSKKIDLLVTPHHMGGGDERYRQFAQRNKYIVVMGFDACICVNANIFGAGDKMPDGSFVPPLSSMTNVITSRSLLVTDGQVFPVNNQNEYGVLTGS